MNNVDLIVGTSGLKLGAVVHLLVPGRGRSGRGDELTKQAIERVKWAAMIYKRLGLQSRGGVIVTSGDKSPGDATSSKENVGISEAVLMKQLLIKQGIPGHKIKAECESIDTVTNLAFSEHGGYFPDNRPIAIIAQDRHLRRIVRVIAPRVLERDYLGIIVPESQAVQDTDTVAAWVASYLILLGVTTRTKNSQCIIRRRAILLWKIAKCLRVAKKYKSEE